MTMNYSMPENLLDQNCNPTIQKPNFYETSNQRDFKGTFGQPAPTARPATSKFYTETKPETANYADEYSWKVVKREKCGRPGSSSGQRKNNPHPNEAFVVWKFTKKKNRDEECLMDDLLEELCKDKIRSTYQVDYEKEKSHYINEKIPKGDYHDPAHTLNTTARAHYQSPLCNEQLNSTTTRFGCGKYTVAVGAVPSMVENSPMMKTCYGTSYGDEFANRESMAEYLKSMSTKEREVVKDLFDNVYKNKEKKEKKKGVERISKWDGPSWK